MTALTVTFTNDSGVAASDVHIGFAPGAPPPEMSVSNVADGSALTAVNAEKGPGVWYTLAELSKGVAVSAFSGRIYVCYGDPWQVQGPGYEPAQSVTDPNFFLRYDKMELTYTGQPADVADLTSIDYWSIPMTLRTRKDGEVVGKVEGLRGDIAAQQAFDALASLTAVTPFGGDGATASPTPDTGKLPAVVPGRFKQFGNGPAPRKTFARVIGPSSYPATGGIPVMPYPSWTDYLRHLSSTFGPGTNPDVVPGLGNGVIAHIEGEFAGVGPNVPATGPQARQSYDLKARIDRFGNITLEGTLTGPETNGKPSFETPVTMRFTTEDLNQPFGIYGGNAAFYLDGASTSTTPGNDVYGWITGDLLSGFNVGAVGSLTEIGGETVGAMPSQEWFTKIPASDYFNGLQPDAAFNAYNGWANIMSSLSEAYNFAYSDRFAHVLVSLDPADVDTLEIVLEPADVDWKK